MSSSGRNMRSVRDIKTISGQTDVPSSSYRAYLKITCLEMERERKLRERESARQRMAAIDERMREIDDEKDRILRVQAEGAGDGEAASRGSTTRCAKQNQAQGFRIQY